MAGLQSTRPGKRFYFLPLLGFALAPWLGCTPKPHAPEAPVQAPQSTPPAETLPATSTPQPVTPTWTEAQQREVLAKTRELTLTPDLSALTTGERACISKLAEVGAIMQSIYERSRHRDAANIRKALEIPGTSPTPKNNLSEPAGWISVWA